MEDVHEAGVVEADDKEQQKPGAEPADSMDQHTDQRIKTAHRTDNKSVNDTQLYRRDEEGGDESTTEGTVGQRAVYAEQRTVGMQCRKGCRCCHEHSDKRGNAYGAAADNGYGGMAEHTLPHAYCHKCQHTKKDVLGETVRNGVHKKPAETFLREQGADGYAKGPHKPGDGRQHKGHSQAGTNEAGQDGGAVIPHPVQDC